MQHLPKIRHVIVVILLVAIFFVFGISVGLGERSEAEKVSGVVNKETPLSTEADFSNFWKVWNTIDEKYPGADKTKPAERIEGAISGLVQSLEDPYSVYFNQEETKAFEEEITGNFSGAGMEVGLKNKVLTVISPLKDTPASRAGIKSGDQILKIDDKIITNMSVDESVKLIRGEKGTTVTLTIFREGENEPREVKIVRDIIDIPTLDIEQRPDGIFVIKLYSFSANSSTLFRNAVKKLTASRSDKLILDLRGNPGGYLDSAIDISSWFLPAGKIVVTEDYGDDRKPTAFRSKGHSSLGDKVKVVILIDGGSASASEIVAGALQDHKRAKIVGTQSFGKGSVQEAIKITPDTLLKITVAKWLTPNGNLIEKKGLTPDFVVEPAAKDAKEGSDPQFDKAVELLIGGKL